VGALYMFGRGTSVNYNEAFRWCKKSADAKDAEGQYGLAMCYFKGYGTQQSNSLAREYLTKSANQGFEPAKKGLQQMNNSSVNNSSNNNPFNIDPFSISPYTNTALQQMEYMVNAMKDLPPPLPDPLPTVNYTPSTSSNNSSSSKSKPQQTGHDLANKRMDETTYDGYATMLMNMCYGNSTYNDSNRLSYQKSMRDIRMKWVNKGYPFTQSSWETWNGILK